jgi:hypothetical protein
MKQMGKEKEAQANVGSFTKAAHTYSILCGYPHIKPRDYTRLHRNLVEMAAPLLRRLCNLVVPTTRY